MWTKESIIIGYLLGPRLQGLLWVNLEIISVLGVRMFEDRVKAAGGWAKCEKREAVWAPPPPSAIASQAKSYFQTECCGPFPLASVSMQLLPYSPLNYAHVGDFYSLLKSIHAMQFNKCHNVVGGAYKESHGQNSDGWLPGCKVNMITVLHSCPEKQCIVVAMHSGEKLENEARVGMKCRQVSAATFTPDTAHLLTLPLSF